MGDFEQPRPVPGQRSVTKAVIQDLLEREKQGMRTYGRSLETFNGRNALLDAYEECLDLAQYLKQRLLEEAEIEANYEASGIVTQGVKGFLEEVLGPGGKIRDE